MVRNIHWRAAALLVLVVSAYAPSQSPNASPDAIPYLQLSVPRRVLPDAQAWEGSQFPHTLSVLELKRGGFRYWGWYGLNEGRGIGLARSNDLAHWTKYAENPLWKNARWPSVLQNADPAHPKRLYFAITRDYDTPNSYIVLANSDDGIHLTQEKTLVQAVRINATRIPTCFAIPARDGFISRSTAETIKTISKSSAGTHQLCRISIKRRRRSSFRVARQWRLRLCSF